jgi:hypothetical protein
MLSGGLRMKVPNARFWFALGCAGCAQLAGFEDFHGGAISNAGAENGGSLSQEGGRVGSGGRTGGNAGNGGRGGSVPAPIAGASSDAGATNTDAGAGGTSSSSGGRPPSTGGSSAGGTGPGGETNDSGGPGAGGSVSGGNSGMPAGGAATGGASNGGTETGGTNGGSATGGVPTATGGGPNTTGCGELVFNGDFSHGRDGWTFDIEYMNLEQNVHPVIAPIGHPKLEPFGVTPESDSYLGWFGGVPQTSGDRVVMVAQEVTISQNVDYFEFAGVYRVETEEDASDPMEYDDFYAELRTIEEDTQLGWQFEHLSNHDANGAWAAMTPQLPDNGDMGALRGRSFYFMLYSRTDENTRTDFWIDSVSLVAVCP